MYLQDGAAEPKCARFARPNLQVGNLARRRSFCQDTSLLREDGVPLATANDGGRRSRHSRIAARSPRSCSRRGRWRYTAYSFPDQKGDPK